MLELGRGNRWGAPRRRAPPLKACAARARRRAARAPLSGRQCWAWVSKGSIGCRFPLKTAFIDAGEIAPRLRTCYSDTLEAPTSGSACRGRPGDVHSARDGWVATISARMAAFSTREFQARFGARSREGRQASRVDPMQQMLPFSLRSSPPSHLGRSGYLRGMLCDLRHIATPLDGLGAGTQSRRDFEVGDSL